jgi:predicted enzyme related to lactoylglutathione lyase
MDLSLTRIILFAYDVEKLKTFYADNFKLPVIEEIKNEWVVLNAGTIEIALHKIGEAYLLKPGTKFKAESNTKLVFTVKTNLTMLRQSFLNAGVNMKEIRSFQGVNSLFCDGEDPEGNVFQLEERL